jgi:hypothetical protein
MNTEPRGNHHCTCVSIVAYQLPSHRLQQKYLNLAGLRTTGHGTTQPFSDSMRDREVLRCSAADAGIMLLVICERGIHYPAEEWMHIMQRS